MTVAEAEYRQAMYGPDTGYVYFITLGEPAIWVKIGFTRSHPTARMATLQTGCPYPMKLHGYTDGTMGLEQDLHNVLSDYRKLGEWFELADRVNEIIGAELRHGRILS